MTAIRSKGVGGSDMGDVLSLEPYGCSRRLWYQKRCASPDYERKTALFDRGHALEPIIADEFRKRLECELVRDLGTLYHPEHDCLFVHLDGMAAHKKHGYAVAEFKTAGREMFRRFQRDGIPEYYIVQVQYAMALVKASLEASDKPELVPAGAIFGVLWPDGWQWEWPKVRRDDEMGGELVATALDWWRRFMEGDEEPERLPPNDERCASCEYRTTCQGQRLLDLAAESGGEVPFVDMGEEFDRLLSQYREAQELKDAAEADEKRLKDRIKELLGDRQVVEVPGWRVYFRAYERKPHTVKGGVVRSLRIYPK